MSRAGNPSGGPGSSNFNTRFNRNCSFNNNNNNNNYNNNYNNNNYNNNNNNYINYNNNSNNNNSYNQDFNIWNNSSNFSNTISNQNNIISNNSCASFRGLGNNNLESNFTNNFPDSNFTNIVNNNSSNKFGDDMRGNLTNSSNNDFGNNSRNDNRNQNFNYNNSNCSDDNSNTGNHSTNFRSNLTGNDSNSFNSFTGGSGNCNSNPIDHGTNYHNKNYFNDGNCNNRNDFRTNSISNNPSSNSGNINLSLLDQKPVFLSGLPHDPSERQMQNQGMLPRLNSVMQPRMHGMQISKTGQPTPNQENPRNVPQIDSAMRPGFLEPRIHPNLNLRNNPIQGMFSPTMGPSFCQEMIQPMNPRMIVGDNPRLRISTVPPPVPLLPPPLMNSSSTGPITIPGGPSSSNPDAVKNAREEYKETMADIVRLWIKSRASLQNSESSATKGLLNLGELRIELKTWARSLEQLRKFNDELAGKMDAEQEEWIQLVANVNKIKSQVTELQTKLFSPQQLEFTENQLKKRKKKRDRIRKQKKQRREQYIASLSTRIKLNEQIDEAIQKQRTEIAMEKMKESVKNEAGETLVEVKRKQKQISEYTNLFKLLHQLREARKETAIYKGIFVTEKDDERFTTRVEDTLKVLSQQEDVCKDEERCLRLLREEEVEEINRVEEEKRKKRKQNREDDLSCVDPMYPFRLYWLQGEESAQGLIHVRTMWDVFLCPAGTQGGSRIPKTMVPPNSSPSPEWSVFSKKDIMKDLTKRTDGNIP